MPPGKKPKKPHAADNTAEGARESLAALSHEVPPASTLPPPSWSNVWNVPLVIISAAFLTAGLVTLMLTRAPDAHGPKLLEAQSLQQGGRFDEAVLLLADLAEDVDQFTPAQQARFHLIRADVFHGKQSTIGGEAEQNYAQVIRDYTRAAELSAELSPIQLFRFADAHLALDHPDEALELLTRMPLEAVDLRDRLLHAVIDRKLARADDSSENALLLIDEVLAEPSLASADRLWAVQRRSQLLLAMGRAEEALSNLLFWIPRLSAAGVRDQAPLLVTLAQCHDELGEYERARMLLEETLPHLSDDAPERAEAIYVLGRLAQLRDQWDEALALADQVVREYPASELVDAARLCRAEASARLEQVDESLEDFRDVVTALNAATRSGRRLREVTVERVTESLLAAHDRIAAQGNLERALQFIVTAEPMHDSAGILPPALSRRLAESHLGIAEAALLRAGQSIQPADPQQGVRAALLNPERMEPTHRVAARQNFLAAARHFLDYSQGILPADPESSFRALLDASSAFDRGGSIQPAIDSLLEYMAAMRGRPELLGAILRLGHLYESAGDFTNAAAQFRRLVEDPSAGRAPEGLAAIVPLARCYLNDRKTPRAVDAERLLLSVVEGGVALDPSSDEYYDALTELGALYARPAEKGLPNPPETYFPRAIQRLTEALERRPLDPGEPRITYLLAHAHRESAQSIDRFLEVTMPEEDRQTYEGRRSQHLRDAAQAYDRVIARFSAIPANRLPIEEAQTLMLARFWSADCAFELGLYENALSLYSAIADQYPRESVGVVALIQIVNAYTALGDGPAARIARQRALQRISQLPADSQSVAMVGLDRESWQRLLEADRLLADVPSSAADPGALSD